nr:immunoglobulin light chain junction region [Macaca mulatta]
DYYCQVYESNIWIF